MEVRKKPGATAKNRSASENWKNRVGCAVLLLIRKVTPEL